MPGKKHKKYRLSNGKMFVMSSTTGDHRAIWKQLSNLRRLLEDAQS